MVAVTLILGVVLYFLVSGPGAPPPQAATLALTVAPYSVNATNASRNDTYLTVDAQLGSGEIWWNATSLQILITDTNGTALPFHTTTIVDTNQDGKATAGDRIVLKGLTAAYRTTHARVLYEGRVVGEVTLP